MKVCIVTTSFPKYMGDTEGTFIWESAQAIRRLGHQVRVIAPHRPGFRTRERMEGLEVFRPRYWWPESAEILGREKGGLPVILKKSWLARLQLLPFIVVHSLAVARWARGCDLVHAHWTLSAWAAWVSRPLHGCPILATLHGSDVYQVMGSRIGAWITGFVLRRCDRISSVSQALAQAAASIGIPLSSIAVIPNGVDTDRFRPSDGPREPVVLFVGNLIKIKGVAYLLEAFSKIGSDYPSYRLVIVGDGPEREFLEKQTADLGLAGRVSFLGSLPPHEVSNWMQRSKILALPSFQEGLSAVVLEALASGTPVVATHVGGNPESISPDVGLLVPPGDSSVLAKAIAVLLGDEDRWSAMSESARAKAETHYRWDAIAELYLTVYRQMIGQA